jgi:hypothetical protein
MKRKETFVGTWRRLDATGARDIRIAQSALRHFEADDTYRPKNVGLFKEKAGGDIWSDQWSVENIALPEPPGHLGDLLAEEHADLTAANPPRMTR